MQESFSLNRLREASIVRRADDAGTLFVGDTPFDQSADLRNFSEGEGSACRVSLVKRSFSSHAGTHADSPAHFQTDTSLPALPEELYSGSSLVLDASKLLRSDFQITRAMLEDVLALHGKRVPDDVRSFLLRTNAENAHPAEAREMFPHLTKEAASFLVDTGARMIGIDTPSVDHPQEKCLSGAVHGLLYEARAAILENVDLSKLSTREGEVTTIFDPTRSFVDARGIAQMYFFPKSYAD